MFLSLELAVARTKKIVLIAGESSGDLLGSDLMKNLKKSHPTVECFGVGGDKMLTEGLQPFFPMSDINLMGVVEILTQIPRIFKRLSQTATQIKQLKPDVVVTIDAQGFSLRLQKRLKKSGIKVVQYVSPTVWAWRAHRAKVLAANTDHILCLYPFEPDYFIREGGKATFVGHPIITQGVEKGDGASFREAHKIPKNKTVISILPGSRRFEIDNLTPLFKKVAENLYQQNADLHFVVPTLPDREVLVKTHLDGWRVPFDVVSSTKSKYDAFSASAFSVAASGTIALELAAASLPTIIAYKVNAMTAFIVRHMVKTPYACMINILNQKPIVPELLQQLCTVENLTQEAMRFMKNKSVRDEQIKYMRKSIEMLSADHKKPGEKASEIVGSYLK